MADDTVPIQLNKGLDLVSPPLLAEPGALIDCLNYELTDISGYRRIDGYERYDGYPDGDITEYYNLRIIATVPEEQALIIPASVIQRVGDTVVDIGAVVGGPFNVDYYDIVSYGNLANFTLAENFLLLQDGSNKVNLQTGTDLLKLQATGSLGSEFRIKTPSGVYVAITIVGTPISGRDSTDPVVYLANLRAYSAVLRTLVTRAPGPIAGLYWFEDRLLAAIDMISMSINVAAASAQPQEGVRLRWNGVIYRLLRLVLTTPGTTNEYRAYLYPIGTSATVNDNLIEVTTADSDLTTWVTGVASLGNLVTDSSAYAALGYYNNTSTSLTRGFTYLSPGTSFEFDGGNYAGGQQPSITLSDDAIPADAYYVVGDGGATVLRVRLTKMVQEGGSFTSSNATGKAQVVVISVVAGARDYIKDNDVIHSEYPTTGSSNVLVVNGTPTHSVLAGTLSLDAVGTKYVWDTYNFYGQSGTLSAYATTGASKAFWANEHGYGTISTGLSDELDIPKYVSFHANKLALGFARGSVVLSVAGEPYNFNGVDGALEVATGDDITGLLELPGATLGVFGKRAIRKITGFTDVDTVLGTIAAGSSCFNYTAVLIGQEAVYTGLHGITTLQQSASYGDFVGARVSDAISTWLRPKLVVNAASVEQGGVALAYPVRSKQQYRLVLLTGEVVIATFTQRGPLLTFMDHGLTGQARLPYCWSSAIGSDGQERIHASWTTPTLRDLAVSIDRGWGFDGQYFNHHFDTAHLFSHHGSNFMGIEQIRMHGQGYGVATLNVKSSGIETNFDQEYHETIQDISMPPTPYALYDRMKPVMGIIDQANWGLGIKLRIKNTTEEGSANIEPSHICQVFVLKLRTEGLKDG